MKDFRIYAFYTFFLFLAIVSNHLSAQVDSTRLKKELSPLERSGLLNIPLEIKRKFEKDSLECYSLKDVATFGTYTDYGNIKAANTQIKIDTSQIYTVDIIRKEAFLRKIPEIVFSFHNLHRFFISRSRLDLEDFERFTMFSCLQRINIDYCNMKNFPSGLAKLPNLRELAIYSNQFNKVPATIFEHPKLEEMNLSKQYSDTLELPKDVKPIGNLKKLDMSYCNIYDIPAGFCNQPNLETLQMNHTKIKKLPKEIHLLKNIRLIDVSDTAIEDLPDELVMLENLCRIDLNRTQLKEFPEVLFKLKCSRLLISLTGTDCTTGEEREAIIQKFKDIGKTKVTIFW